MKSYTYIEVILPGDGTGVSLRRPTMWHRDEPVWLWGLPAMLALSGKPGSLLEPPHSGLPALWPHPCAMLSRSVMSNSCDPMDCSLPGSSVHGDSPGKNTWVGCHDLLQGIFPTQGLNPGLSHCRWIVYHLSHQGNQSIHHTNLISALLQSLCLCCSSLSGCLSLISHSHSQVSCQILPSQWAVLSHPSSSLWCTFCFFHHTSPYLKFPCLFKYFTGCLYWKTAASSLKAAILPYLHCFQCPAQG